MVNDLNVSGAPIAADAPRVDRVRVRNTHRRGTHRRVSRRSAGQAPRTDRPDVHELEIVYPWWNSRETGRGEGADHELAAVYPWWAASA